MGPSPASPGSGQGPKRDPPTDGDPQDIGGAESAAYTPANADKSYFLRVTAMYTDGAEEITVGPRTAVETAAHAVLEVLDLKRPPAFPEYPDGGIAADGTVTVEVAENSPSTTYVGEAIVGAVDPDGTTLIYTLEGDDAEFFELAKIDHDDNVNTPEANTDRQIRVKALVVVEVAGEDDTYPGVDLNHEGDKGTYTVELKASDGDLDDTITVTIRVTDRNEAPSTPIAASGAGTALTNNAPEFQDAGGTAITTGTREVVENTVAGENIGAPVEATDADAGDTLTYTLSGADAASFDIDPATGQLMTMAALDFEDPADADTDNAYEVTVTASDGTDSDAIDVTISVTNADTTGSAVGNTYDANENGVIDVDEVLQAVDDYFDDIITDVDEVLEVVDLYFDGSPS